MGEGRGGGVESSNAFHIASSTVSKEGNWWRPRWKPCRHDARVLASKNPGEASPFNPDVELKCSMRPSSAAKTPPPYPSPTLASLAGGGELAETELENMQAVSDLLLLDSLE